MINKIKTAFFCTHCGYESAKWLGKCPACDQWNAFVEEVIHKEKKETWQSSEHPTKQQQAIRLEDITIEIEKRMDMQDIEINRVLGGGLVLGSIVLIAGEPGIGKSTLLLQQALQLQQIKVLYVSGEESVQQIGMRAQRVGIANASFYLFAETELPLIFQEIKKITPQIVIIDSIQTLRTDVIEASSGSISQVRECTSQLQRFAKETNTPVILVGHITKDGTIAGPKILEHIVDTVLQFEGDHHYAYRILRTVKNRFGSTAELGIYEMHAQGMRQVNNPSELLISQKDEAMSGSAIATILEGLRPLLIEVQSLVTQSVYGTPQRTVHGFDLRRLQLLLAVLEKKGGFLFGTKDVFLNIAGGIKVEDPAVDLSIVASLLSAYYDKPIATDVCFAGEIGLSGEIRVVNRIEQRIAEAQKLGFKNIIFSKYHKIINPSQFSSVMLSPINTIEQLPKYIF